jgi:hypothetical protein
VLRLGLLAPLLAAAAAMAAPRPVAALPVDLELVLAVDCSRSIDVAEFALQIQGYASALRRPGIVRAIQSGIHRRIAVTYVQWAGTFLQSSVIEWTQIADEESATEFAERMASTPRTLSGGGTSLSGVIDYARGLFAENGFEGRRLVIDISGDGINNSGRQAAHARDEAVAMGLTINGLPILTEVPWLDDYFRDNVIGGVGAFVIPAPDFEAFASAIYNKLIREIAGDAWPAVLAEDSAEDGAEVGPALAQAPGR